LPGNFEYRLGVYAGLLGLEDGRGIEAGLLHGPLMASGAISFLLVGAYPFLVGHERRRMDGRGNDSHQTNDDGVTTYLAQSLHFGPSLASPKSKCSGFQAWSLREYDYRAMKLAILRSPPQPGAQLDFGGGAECPLWVKSCVVGMSAKGQKRTLGRSLGL
jgi:hypothetical protein